MKTNITIISLLMIIFSSCSTPNYLPKSSEIDVNEYGSYIQISLKKGPDVSGEFIMIDNNNIIILLEQTKNCLKVSLDDVKRFKLRYAKPTHYGWTIPTFILYPFIHGLYSFLTIPLHLIVTISVTASGESAFQYSEEDMTYDKLRMFARFPQGIPANIDLAEIK
jgi:hypothetical protein